MTTPGHIHPSLFLDQEEEVFMRAAYNPWGSGIFSGIRE